jgi:hypothetical protein
MRQRDDGFVRLVQPRCVFTNLFCSARIFHLSFVFPIFATRLVVFLERSNGLWNDTTCV